MARCSSAAFPTRAGVDRLPQSLPLTVTAVDGNRKEGSSVDRRHHRSITSSRRARGGAHERLVVVVASLALAGVV